MCHVIVLHAVRSVAYDPAQQQSLLGRLPYGYRLALERRDPPDRAASLQALGLLDHGIRRLRAAPLEFSALSFPDGGKPSLAGGPHFSISHCARRVVVALSERHELGVDVEHVGAHGRGRADLERWTAVEATLKALGTGVQGSPQVRLAQDLASAELAGTVVHLRPIALSADCVATLAARQSVAWVEVEECGTG